MPTYEWVLLSEDFLTAMWEHEEQLLGESPMFHPVNTDYENMFCAGWEL